ncbi:pyridoxamine kinase [Clostridioides difficile]|uniref:pyridoxamine kinase n=1 Tax=Clostridioides difficile TaxID=1496 RepID=UPI000BB1D44B|nr:pyridoxamine kinase [Clostridioides difficile]MBY2209538.1 pyridoxamine kinase [Clostridioides difficile]MBZ0594670.1 pyridoxamine kinase [Clostridioides difficile]PBH61618.1 pyridoxine kinase [Clostridioides difficile]HBG0706795.1 pyridoxamine kinase [Clostridioides difficile]
MQKKVAAINDLSGIGKCSLSVAIPILSALKVQCCPFPTAILSSQTGYPEFTFLDFTDEMVKYSNVWKNLKVNFDSIYSGFLGSKHQIEIVANFINDYPNAFIVVDPVMGDNGVMYPIFTEEMRQEIKELVKHSDLTTPNLTEACFLTGNDYTKSDYNRDELIYIAKSVSDLGPSKVVITGILEDDNILNLAYDRDNDHVFFTSVKYNNCSYSGTGDIFTSILCGMLVNKHDLGVAINTATDFIYKTINYTSQFDTERNDGVMFENFLSDLTNI